MQSPVFVTVVSALAATAAAAPVELLLDRDTLAQPGDVQILRFGDSFYGDRQDLVFSALSRVGNGSQLDRIFRLPAGETVPQFIGFSDTTVDGQQEFISFFDGLTDDGRALVTDGGRVLGTGPDITPPFTSILDRSSLFIGYSGPTPDQFNITAFGNRTAGLVAAGTLANFNPFVRSVYRSLNGVNEIVLEQDAIYQLDDGPFVAESVGNFIDITNSGIVISSISRAQQNGGGFGQDERLISIDPDDNSVSEILEVFGSFEGAGPDERIGFIDDFSLRSSDRPSVAFTGGIQNASGFSNAIFYSEDGDALPRLLARTDEPVAGGSEPVISTSFDLFMAEESGDVVFSAQFEGTLDTLFIPRFAYFYGDPNDLSVLRAFEPIPGTAKLPRNIDPPQLSPDGLVAFKVEAYDDPINEVGFSEVLLATNAAGNLQFLAESGTRVPEFDRDGLLAFWNFFQFPSRFTSNKSFNSCGQLIIESKIRYFDADGNFFGDELDGIFRFQLFHPDTNCDGVLDLADIVNFVAAFSNADPAADSNGDGLFDLTDIVAFVTAFNDA